MALLIEIDSMGPNFKPRPGRELARLLREIATRLDAVADGDVPNTLVRDADGVEIGSWCLYDRKDGA